MKIFSNKITWISTVLIVIAIGIIFTFQGTKPSQLQQALVSIQNMGHLVSLKVNVADVVEFTKDNTLGIPWMPWEVKYGAIKVLLIIRGDCAVATDLRAAALESIDKANKTVTIVLPTPAVLSPRLIHAPPGQGGTEIYAITKQGLTAIIPGDGNLTQTITSAMSLAQKKVEEAGKSKEVVEAAKNNTEYLLKKFLTALDWNASIKWK